MPAGIAIAMAVGSIASAKIASNASKNAANAQVNASNNALDYQKQIFGQLQPMAMQGMQQAQNQYAPYQRIGNSALDALYQRLGLSPGTLQSNGQQPNMGYPPPQRQPFAMPQMGGPVTTPPFIQPPQQIPPPVAPTPAMPQPYGQIRQPLGVYGSQ